MATLKRFFFHLILVSLGFLILFNSLPIFAFASTSGSNFQVAGWIPYWHDSEGIKDAKKNIKNIDMVFPFSFVVKEDGSLKDLADMESSEWTKFVKQAHGKKVKVVPTVMWSNADSIETNLSDGSLRKHHIDGIVAMVNDGGYDGVDIDYEGKRSATKDSFSAFLTELKVALGSNKILACTIEARTPPESLYKTIPNPLLYSNDFKVIAKVCDTVEIMAYDQQRADLKNNAERIGQPYVPVADVAWVEKVLTLALVDIPADKILLGIPTYGHHYEVTVSPGWYKEYRKVGALNMPDMLDVAKEYRVKPVRNSAGEMGFSYIPKSSTLKFPSDLEILKNTPSGNKVAVQALAYANKTGETVKFNYASFTDVGAIEEKVALAKEYKLRGVALFKFDGEEDKRVWKILR